MGTARDMLTRKIGGFEFRKTIDTFVTDAYLDDVGHHEAVRKARTLQECESWVDLVWYVERIKEEQFEPCIVDREGQPEMKVITKTALVDFVKKLPQGSVMSLDFLPSKKQRGLIHSDKDTKFLCDLREKIEEVLK